MVIKLTTSYSYTGEMAYFEFHAISRLRYFNHRFHKNIHITPQYVNNSREQLFTNNS